MLVGTDTVALEDGTGADEQALIKKTIIILMIRIFGRLIDLPPR